MECYTVRKTVKSADLTSKQKHIWKIYRNYSITGYEIKNGTKENMKYQIEHIGFSVDAPIEMAKWYQDILGFNIKLSLGDNQHGVAFIEDESCKLTLEVFKIPETTPLKNHLEHHLQFHIAFECDDPDLAASELVKHGATFIENCPRKIEGDYLVVLNDPWGNCIQFVKRKEGRFGTS